MIDVNSFLALANEAAEYGPDMNEAVSGGSGARLLPVGNAFAVLIGVVELGKHPQEYNGKAKDSADEVQLTFALMGQGFNGEKYANDDGTPYILRCYPFAMSRNEKARAFLTFKKMNWKGTAKSFPQLLGQAFFLPIKQQPKSKTDAAPVSRPDLTGILPPLDAMTGQPYQVPQVDPKLFHLFLWEKPTIECWDSIYIDGAYDDGESKNVIQGTVTAALNFQGSPIQQLLLANNLPIPSPRKARSKPAAAPAAPAGPAPATPPIAAPAAPPAVPGVPAPAGPAALYAGAGVGTAPSVTAYAAPVASAPGVASPGPLAPPAVAAVPPAAMPAPPSPGSQSVTPAGSTMTFPSSPALPGMPGIPTPPAV